VWGVSDISLLGVNANVVNARGRAALATPEKKISWLG